MALCVTAYRLALRLRVNPFPPIFYSSGANPIQRAMGQASIANLTTV